MTSCVLDANIAIWAVFPGPWNVEAEALLQSMTRIVVPSLWMYEVTSAVRQMMVHVGGTEEEANRLLEVLWEIPDEVIPADGDLMRTAYHWATRLGQRAAYDAFYVALAERLKLPLWTGDQALYRQAQKAGADFVKRFPAEWATTQTTKGL